MKVPRWKLFFIKKLTIWPRAIIYLLIYFLGFIYTLNTNVDTNWNSHILGTINRLFPSLKGIVSIILFILVKVMIYFFLILLLEHLLDGLSKINISSKEFSQTVIDKKLSLNERVYPVSEVILMKKAWGKRKVRKISGKISASESEGDFEFNFSVLLTASKKLIKQLKKRAKEITWWEANRIKLWLSLFLSLVMVVFFFLIGGCFFF